MITYESRIEVLHAEGKLSDAQFDKGVAKGFIGKAKADTAKAKKKPKGKP